MNDIVNDIVKNIVNDNRATILWTTNRFAHKPHGLIVIQSCEKVLVVFL